MDFPSLDKIHTIIFDFDGVFTDNKVYLSQSGEESVCCSRADGLGLNLLNKICANKKLNINLFILSKEKNPVVLSRAKKIGLACHSGVDDKLAFIKCYFSRTYPENKSPFEGFIYLGNDLNDLSVIDVAGFSVAPSDAHPLVKSSVSVVLDVFGGAGFVREFIEKLIRIDQLKKGEVNELISNC